jgi:hypothetical protein
MITPSELAALFDRDPVWRCAWCKRWFSREPFRFVMPDITADLSDGICDVCMVDARADAVALHRSRLGDV